MMLTDEEDFQVKELGFRVKTSGERELKSLWYLGYKFGEAWIWPSGGKFNKDRCSWLVDIDQDTEELLEGRGGVEFDDLIAACLYITVACPRYPE